MGGGTALSCSAPSLPPPCPRSPTACPDLSGRRRDLLNIQLLQREITSLEGELKYVQALHPASTCCKELIDSVDSKPDPFIPIKKKKITKPCRLWKWICKSPCVVLSWICCCPSHLKTPACCSCNCSLPKLSCNGCPCLPSCSGSSCCCRPVPCPNSSCKSQCPCSCRIGCPDCTITNMCSCFSCPNCPSSGCCAIACPTCPSLKRCSCPKCTRLFCCFGCRNKCCNPTSCCLCC